MKKKLLIRVSLLCMLCCLIAAIPMRGNAADNNFTVGYSRVDINPYVVDGNFSSGIMALPLAGTGDVWNRLSKNTLMDDNGDGVIDQNDGLKATCIAVSDKDGTTVLLITVDVIGMHFLSKITEEVTKRVEAEIAAGNLTDVKLAKENIYAASTHTHNAPDTASYRAAGKTGVNNDGVDLSVVNENLGIWLERTVVDIGDAAIEALKDRASAVLSKDQLSASDATSEAVAGKTMTMTRHYVVSDDPDNIFVAGDNFNATTGKNTSRGDDPKQVTEADDTIYLLNFQFENTQKLPIVLASWRGHPSLNNTDSYGTSTKKISSDYVSAFRHGLEYGVEVSVDQTNKVGNVTGWTLGTQQKYRVAFFNATGGNTNPRGCELVRDALGNIVYGTDNKPIIGYSWIDKSASVAPIKGRGCSYGVVLATFANECLTDGKNETVATPGEITSATKTFKADRKTVGCSQLAYDAGQACNAGLTLYNAANATYQTAKTMYEAYVEAQQKVDNTPYVGELVYGSARDKAKAAYQEAMAAHDEALAPFVAFMAENSTNTPTKAKAGTSYAAYPDEPLWSYPWIYKNAEGEVFVIGSKYHINYVIGDWNNALGIPYTTGINVTVNAFMLGEDIAFVTIPGEPFDYYFRERGIYTPENNMWNDLLGDAYGMPYIMGYTNGWQRYFPNIEAYYYNEGSTTKTFASYEVHNSDFEAGTGERAVGTLDAMLAYLEAKPREAECRHCGETVTWQPYRGQAKLDTGHYYLCSDYELSNQLRFVENCNVCFDLNGYTLTGVGRAFYLDDNKNETLNIFDSSATQTGAAEGIAADTGAPRGYGGGTVYLGPGSTINFYSGTLRAYEKTNYSCQTGTVIRARGVFNMYGGKVEGGAASSFTGQYINNGKPAIASREGQGGAIYVDGSFNLYGGSVTGGWHQLITGEVFGNETDGYGYRETVEKLEGTAPCVYVTEGSPVLLAGNGSVESLYLAGGTAAKLTVQGTYTGTVEISYPEGTTLELGQKIAAAAADDSGRAADVFGAAISFRGVEKLTAAVKDGQLVVDESAQSYIYCRGCEDYFRWTAITDAQLDQSGNTKGMAPGHYILTEHVTTTQKQLNPDGKNPGAFCFDLNGYEFHGATRAFYVYTDATLNLQDSCGTGFVQGDKGANNYGGSMYCQGSAAVINVYGTTVKGTPVTNLRGSAFFIISGTVNLYDARVEGGHSKEYGAAIYCGNSAKLNVCGGAVIAGTTEGKGSCVFADTSGKVTVSGAATVDEIYIYGKAAAAVTVDASAESFSGTATLRFESPVTKAGTDVGNITGELGMANGEITVADTGMAIIADGTNLITANRVVSLWTDGKEQQFATMEKALEAYPGSGYLRLNESVAADIVITQNTNLDLAGKNITGNITVSQDATLYCMDSATDDYTVFDGNGFGLISGQITGTLQPVPYGSVSACEAEGDPYRAGYLRIDRPEGSSFHRVNLQVSAVALRPGCAGLYYRCPFKADEVAAEEIYGFGVALSVFAVPNGETLEGECEYSRFDAFEGGPQGNGGQSTGTLLQNIMRTSNSNTVNAANAGVPVYGRAYVLTESGYVFGEPVSCSLQNLLTGVDAIWETLSVRQQEGVLEMYDIYGEVMQLWELPHIKSTIGN